MITSHRAMPLLVATGLFANALPTWVTANVPPVLSIANQAAALIGWGLFVMASAACSASGARAERSGVAGYWFDRRGLLALVAIAGLLILASAVSAWRGAPYTLALARSGTLIAASLVLCCGWQVMRSDGAARQGGEAFLWCLLIAGSVNAAIGFVQVIAPAWADEFLIATMRDDRRASGNLRQPNLLATQVVWALAAGAALCEMRRLHRGVFIGLGLALLPMVVLTGSRIGLLSVCALTLWAVVDRRLSRPTRWMLASVPLQLVAARWVIDAAVAGPTRLRPLDMGSSRYPMWLDTLRLIGDEPWWGVGLGEFNFAWTLTPSAYRAHETFTHTHNLFLQWAVELGLPLTIAIVALLFMALRHAVGTARVTSGDDGIVRRCALVIVSVVLLHSQTEFPLWYAQFLLPTAFALGLLVAPALVDRASLVAARERDRTFAAGPTVVRRALGVGGLLLIAGGVAVHRDHASVAAIFEPLDSAALMQRIEEGRRSLLFGHHADRYAATLQPWGRRSLEPYQRALHEMLDIRLLIAWSQALDENGETERARYVAARVREFVHPAARQFFAVCERAQASTSPPFQCTPAAREFGYRDFR